VLLVEKNPTVARIWSWLISASEAEIKSLPIHEPGEKVHPSVTGPARDWIGFWNAFGQVAPQEKMVPSAGSNPKFRGYFWNETFRDRTADAVGRIRHWHVLCCDYRDIVDVEATWFVDPPYVGLNHYRQGDIDYSDLALWCASRTGQVIVCENEGADWLPFEPFSEVAAAPRANNRGKGGGRRSKEAICTWDSAGEA
jgi:hypothetical protein